MHGRGRLHLRPFRAGDHDLFEPRADFVADRAMVGWDWEDGAPGFSWTVLDRDNRVMGIGGAVKMETRGLLASLVPDGRPAPARLRPPACSWPARSSPSCAAGGGTKFLRQRPQKPQRRRALPGQARVRDGGRGSSPGRNVRADGEGLMEPKICTTHLRTITARIDGKELEKLVASDTYGRRRPPRRGGYLARVEVRGWFRGPDGGVARLQGGHHSEDHDHGGPGAPFR